MTTTILEQREIARPEYLRLPKPGSRCALTGLSRATLAELAVPCEANGHKPPVRSFVIKKRGAIRGIRLINFDSLMDHLHSLESQLHPAMQQTKNRAQSPSFNGQSRNDAC